MLSPTFFLWPSAKSHSVKARAEIKSFTLVWPLKLKRAELTSDESFSPAFDELAEKNTDWTLPPTLNCVPLESYTFAAFAERTGVKTAKANKDFFETLESA